MSNLSKDQFRNDDGSRITKKTGDYRKNIYVKAQYITGKNADHGGKGSWQEEIMSTR